MPQAAEQPHKIIERQQNGAFFQHRVGVFHNGYFGKQARENIASFAAVLVHFLRHGLALAVNGTGKHIVQQLPAVVSQFAAGKHSLRQTDHRLVKGGDAHLRHHRLHIFHVHLRLLGAQQIHIAKESNAAALHNIVLVHMTQSEQIIILRGHTIAAGMIRVRHRMLPHQRRRKGSLQIGVVKQLPMELDQAVGFFVVII